MYDYDFCYTSPIVSIDIIKTRSFLFSFLTGRNPTTNGPIVFYRGGK